MIDGQIFIVGDEAVVSDDLLVAPDGSYVSGMIERLS
jgi:hypothetical protein